MRRRLACQLPLAAGLRCLLDVPHAFALVGAWAGGGALLGCAPVRTAHDREDPFALLASAGAGSGVGPGVGGGWVGYLGYPLRRCIERVQPSPPATGSLPAFALAYYDHLVRRDRDGSWWFEALWCDERATALEDRLAWWSERLANPPAQRAASCDEWRVSPTPDAHAQLVAACRERIHAGDLYQANICAELQGRLDGPALELFIRGVTALEPDRAAYLAGPWGQVVSLSPELFLERRGRHVRTAPIKGTSARSQDPNQAAAERRGLEASDKDRAENIMIVDLMRNDLGRVCEPASIVADPIADVHPHVGVWHMVSEVRGTLRPGVDDAQLLAATFPPGSVTGAPKIAAMNVIAELESTDRTVYTGAIGFASPLAGLELSVAIRTFEVSGSSVRLGVGGGVVADSDPQREAAELAVKAAPLLDALGARMASRATPPEPAPPVRRLRAVPVSRPDAALGVFETLLVREGRAHQLDAHIERLRGSVAALYGAPLPTAVATNVESMARSARASSRLRVLARPCANGELDILLEIRPLLPQTAARLRVWTLPGGLGAHKWNDRRMLAEVEARSGAEVPLFVDADGFVLETSRANLFALGPDGALRTPPDDGRILPGVARAALIAGAAREGIETIETPLDLGDLRRADAVLLTNALRTVPALAIDELAFNHDRALPARIRTWSEASRETATAAAAGS